MIASRLSLAAVLCAASLAFAGGSAPAGGGGGGGMVPAPHPQPTCCTTLPAHGQVDPKIEFETYKLPNGLEVILAPDRTAPLVAVNVWYHVGSGDEVPGKSGFAHLFEHMMFQGSKNVGTDRHFEILRKIGSNEINGTTN